LAPVGPRSIDTPHTITEFSPQLGLSPAQIHRDHRRVRDWQVERGQNVFADINDSEHDLTHLDTFYLDGGTFQIAFKVTGFVGLHDKGNGVGALKRMAVMPEDQGNHTGPALVFRTLQRAKELGFQQIGLSTGRLERALPIYKYFGFEITGYDPAQDDWKMELDLSEFDPENYL
jgi:N-acetylglutamate synthase-like GNAT family acetyltransferase